jgi:hypothetical protein
LINSLVLSHLIRKMSWIRVHRAYSPKYVKHIGAFMLMIVSVCACATRPMVRLESTEAVIKQFCPIGNEPDKPFVAGWSADERQDLVHLSTRGGILLSYKGCTMKVLSHCRSKGRYQKTISTPDKKEMEITDSGRLYSELPMGARSLSAKLESGHSLKLSYVIAATQSLSQIATRQTIKGPACADATHYVETENQWVRLQNQIGVGSISWCGLEMRC